MRYMRVYDSGNFNGNKEEGIYKVKQYLGMSNCYECYDSNNKRHLFNYKAGKRADTIEELCDEFRGVWTNYFEDGKDAHEEYHYYKEKNVFYDDFEELTHKEAIEKFDIFYGAIWTDRGLIYVAIMNEKGELELL